MSLRIRREVERPLLLFGVLETTNASASAAIDVVAADAPGRLAMIGSAAIRRAAAAALLNVLKPSALPPTAS